MVSLAVIYFLFAKEVFSINVILLALTIGALLIGLTLPFINIPTSTKVMTLTEKDKLGKVSSVMDVGSQGLIPLSNLLAGLVISSFGPSWLLIICAAGLCLLTVVLFVSKQIKQL